VLSKSSNKKFIFASGFYKRRFLSNFFVRKMWRGKFTLIKLPYAANFSSFMGFKEDFLYSKFSFKFLKYLFSVRFSRNIVSPNFYFLSFYYLSVFSSVFVLKSNKIKPLIKSRAVSNLVAMRRKNFLPGLFGG